MGKTKKTDELFSLKKELRECNETILNLERQLALYKKEKNEQKKEQKKEKIEKKKAKELEKKSQLCPDCQIGTKVYADLGIRKITTCSNKCGYKEVVKTNVEKEEI